MRFFILLLLLINCSSLVHTNYLSAPKFIEDSIQGFLKKGNINLIIINPPDLQNHTCNYTEDFFWRTITDTDFQMNQSLLKKFSHYKNFRILERKNFKYLLEEMKLQVNGFTATELSRIGNLTGANYIIINESELYCSKGDLELIFSKTSKLVGIESGEVFALDKLVLNYKLNRKEYELEKASLREKKIIYP